LLKNIITIFVSKPSKEEHLLKTRITIPPTMEELTIGFY